MDIKEELASSNSLEAALEEQKQPLLIKEDPDEKNPDENPKKKTPTQKAIRKTFKMSAHLANLLPTGSVLAFQILAPVFTHRGNCKSLASQYLTLSLLGISGFSCFIACFTDSIRDSRGKIHHGLATFQGLWVIDGMVTLTHEEAEKYRIRFVDFFHGFLSMIVFAGVVLFDHNVVHCFYPNPSEQAQDLLASVPIGVGVVCSLLFVAFPTTRHGIGFPLSRK